MARYGARRPPATRPTLPIVILVCDDAVTAPAYFLATLSSRKHQRTIRVVPALHDGATGADIIKKAADELNDLSDPEGATVWAVVDLEMISESERLAHTYRTLASKKGIELALSQPCFEVWILAHFVNTGERFENCNAALKEVKAKWYAQFRQRFPSKKSRADYGKLTHLVLNAVAFAKAHDEKTCQSWTEVWRIMEQLN